MQSQLVPAIRDSELEQVPEPTSPADTLVPYRHPPRRTLPPPLSRSQRPSLVGPARVHRRGVTAGGSFTWGSHTGGSQGGHHVQRPRGGPLIQSRQRRWIREACGAEEGAEVVKSVVQRADSPSTKSRSWRSLRSCCCCSPLLLPM
eukprot:1106618-Prorocentrum_minimum.AAC.1